MNSIIGRTFLCTTLLAVAATAYAQDTTRTYTNAHGREVIVHTGMPSSKDYGAKPDFAALDSNHDGSISREEARAFPPLLNDFAFVAHNGERNSAKQYAQWDYR